MKLPLIVICALLALGCAHQDAPRAAFEPKELGDPGNTEGWRKIQPTPDDAHPSADSKQPCGGKCEKGEYCDRSSGIDRCIKDVIPGR